MLRLWLPIGSEVDKIVHWMSQILFTAEIVLRGLHRCVPQQKLDLLQFTTAIVAELRTGPPQVVGSNVL